MNSNEPNTKVVQLEEAVLDAEFSLLMYKAMLSEGEELLLENERLKNDPEFQLPEALDDRCLRAINRKFAKSKLSHITKRVSKFAGRVAAVIVVMVSLAGVTIAAVPKARSTVMNYFVENFGKYSTITVDGVPDSNTYTPELRWIPDGFYKDASPEGDPGAHLYRKDENTYFLFAISASSAVVNLDTENADAVNQIDINGSAGTIVIRDKSVRAIWLNASGTHLFFIHSVGLSPADILKIAENIE